MTELPNTAGAWLRGYGYDNLFTCNRNQRNLVTVTVTQTHGERVSHLHSSLVTWLRGYMVTQIFSNQILTFFLTVTVTVTSVTWLRLRLRRHIVRGFHIYTVAWLRGYAVTWLHKFFQTKF